jgi:hypothetical protein
LIGDLQDDLVTLRENLKEARAAAKTYRIRIELAAIERAGSTKRFGESAEIRERKLHLLWADDPECQRLEEAASALESQVAHTEVKYDRAMRAITYFQWLIREKLTDTLDRLAGRPCNAKLEHLLHNMVAEATGEKDEVYAGESDWIAQHRVG